MSLYKHLTPSSLALQDEFELIDIDTLFFIDNRGLDRILIDLNGSDFKMVTDPQEIERSSNAFLMPEFGMITVDIADYIIPGGPNIIDITPLGPADTDAFLLIGDLLVPGQTVAYDIENLIEIPDELDLLQSYPNPFNTQTTITYEIPDEKSAGARVQLAIYDVNGQHIQTLLSEIRYPGQFTTMWDGRGANNQPLASGVYLCVLTVDNRKESRKVVLVR